MKHLILLALFGFALPVLAGTTSRPASSSSKPASSPSRSFTPSPLKAPPAKAPAQGTVTFKNVTPSKPVVSTQRPPPLPPPTRTDSSSPRPQPTVTYRNPLFVNPVYRYRDRPVYVRPVYILPPQRSSFYYGYAPSYGYRPSSDYFDAGPPWWFWMAMYQNARNDAATRERLENDRREWTRSGDCVRCHHVRSDGHPKVEQEW